MSFRRATFKAVRRLMDASPTATTGSSMRSCDAMRHASAISTTDQEYKSPFRAIFKTIEEGKTFLGTTEFQMPDSKTLRCGIPEHVLRFKTTTYGRLLEEPFVRPMEHRVTLQVSLKHAPLNEMERMVLKEIVGTRLNDKTDILQLSSAQFGSRIENKRHVVSMLDRIVENAKSLSEKVQEEMIVAHET